MSDQTCPTVIIPATPGDASGSARRMGELAHLQTTGEMDTETFRAAGHALIDWIADEHASVGFAPILPQIPPAVFQQHLPVHPPLEPAPMNTLLSEVPHLFLPAMIRHYDPRCLAEGAAPITGPALLGEMLTVLLGAPSFAMESPAHMTLEQRVLAWWREMLGLPCSMVGALHDAATSATLTALATARDAACHAAREHGEPSRLRLYCSPQAHPSLLHVAHVLGIGREGVRVLLTEEGGKLATDQLVYALQEDRAAGYLPCAVIATLGAGHLDPVPALAEICARFHLWLHVDAREVGGAAIDPTRHWLLDGCQDADSLVITPWFVGARTSLLYFRTPPPHAIVWKGDNVLQPHRWLALPLWMLLRSFGQVGLVRRIRHQCRLAQEFARWIEHASVFELLTPPLLTTVCFRAHPPGMTDEEALHTLNERLCTTINASGRFVLSASWLGERSILTLTISNMRTLRADLHLLWVWLQELVQHAGTKLKTDEHV